MKGDVKGIHPVDYCDVCMCCAFWWREPSVYGGSGEWVCSICRPEPCMNSSNKVLVAVISSSDFDRSEYDGAFGK